MARNLLNYRKEDSVKLTRIAVVVVLAVIVVVTLVWAQAKPAPVPAAPVASSLTSGRYQVVNGTPDVARNIMLLDTATGRTWIQCDSDDGTRGWCHMPQWADTTGPKK